MSSIINEKMDGRQYVDIDINGVTIEGMLDSGANISVLGSGGEQFIKDSNSRLFNLSSSVQVASGENLSVLGYIHANVSFNNKKFSLKLFVVPALKQKLYLGMDFFKEIGLKMIVNEVEILKGPTDKDDLNKHVLNSEDQRRLDEIVSLFPAQTLKALDEQTHSRTISS